MVRTIPTATTLARHRLKTSIRMRRTAGHLLLVAKAGAIRLERLVGRLVKVSKSLLAPLLHQRLPLALKQAVNQAARAVVKVMVEEPPQAARLLLLLLLRLVRPASPSKMTVMTTMMLYSSRCRDLWETVSVKGK